MIHHEQMSVPDGVQSVFPDRQYDHFGIPRDPLDIPILPEKYGPKNDEERLGLLRGLLLTSLLASTLIRASPTLESDNTDVSSNIPPCATIKIALPDRQRLGIDCMLGDIAARVNFLSYQSGFSALHLSITVDNSTGGTTFDGEVGRTDKGQLYGSSVAQLKGKTLLSGWIPFSSK